MKKTFFILTLLFVLALPIQAFAEEEATFVDPGITPDSPFYFLDRMLEGIELGLAFDTVKEIEVVQEIADERLAESDVMIQEGNLKLGEQAVFEYQDNLDLVNELLNEAIAKGIDVKLTIKSIEEYSQVKEDTLQNITDSLPEEAKEELEHRVTATQSKYEIVKVVLTEKIQDVSFLEKSYELGLEAREILAITSLASQSEITLEEALTVFLAEGKDIGATAKALGLEVKTAMEEVNTTFESAKKESKLKFVSIKKMNEDKKDEDKNDEDKNDEDKNDEDKNDEDKDDGDKDDEDKNDEDKNNEDKDDEDKKDEDKKDEDKDDEDKDNEDKNDEDKDNEDKNDE